MRKSVVKPGKKLVATIKRRSKTLLRSPKIKPRARASSKTMGTTVKKKSNELAAAKVVPRKRLKRRRAKTNGCCLNLFTINLTGCHLLNHPIFDQNTIRHFRPKGEFAFQYNVGNQYLEG